MKSAIVFGGANGIGRASAFALAHRGASLVIADLEADSAAATAAEMRIGGHEALSIAADITDHRQVDAAVELATSRFGRLDWAVNAAGYPGVQAPLTEWLPNEVDKLHAINLKGTWHCLTSEIRAMVATGGGAIVNVASVGGMVASPTLSLYGATKSAVINLTMSAAVEYAASNIRVNTVCPGAISTRMMTMVLEDPTLRNVVEGRAPLGRLGRPEEVGNAIAFLCSDEASYITGVALPVDGGIMAR